jgi:SAM-dependent methyltransferase
MPLRSKWEDRYDGSSPRPWDTGITPPEIVRFWEEERPIPGEGIGLDIGCGTGTNALYLARQGLHVMGVDLSGRALQLARQRVTSQAPHLSQRILFAQSDASRIPLAADRAIYVMDVGCLHGLPLPLRDGYTNCVFKATRPGAYFQIYGFDTLPDDPEHHIHGLEPNEVAERFGPAFDLIHVVRGEPERRPCRWYTLRRRG